MKETKRFWSKISERKDHKNAESIDNVETDLRILEKGPKVEIHHDTLKAIVKIIPNWKTPVLDGIYGFSFKKSLLSMTYWRPKRMNA